MNETIAAAGASAEAPDAEGVHRIYPGNGVPPGSETWTQAESTMQVPWPTSAPRRLSRNVVIPTLTVFRPAPGKANGTAMVVAPGGAYHFVMIDHEGYDMARWLTERGITAFVLKYRLARTPDADADLLAFRNNLQERLARARAGNEPPAIPDEVRIWGEDDGRQAIRYVRAHAAEFGIDPARVGVAGFSAGGGVALGTVLNDDPATRPDFACGVYPAYRPGLPMPADAPPLFLVISHDDRSVSPLSAVRLYEAWHQAGRSAELHIFGNGAHGWGMAKEGFLSDPWIELFGNWLRVRGLG